MKLETEDGTPIDPMLSMAESDYHVETIQFPYFDSSGDGIFERPIATELFNYLTEKVKIATVYDLMTSQYGVQRFEHELEATSYDDASSKYTPAWQEQITGIKRVSDESGKRICTNAIDTGGRSMIIMGLVSTIGLTRILFIVQYLT